MRVLVIVLGVMLGCAHPEATVKQDQAAIVITDEAELAAHVGQTVILRGEVSRTRIPTLLGVDIEDGGMAGEQAEALGVLEREVVTQAEIDEQVATSGQFANRGGGTFYRLVAPGGRGLATARPVTAP